MLYYIIGCLIIVLGIFINFTVNKRRFNRRGPGGLQHFNSYGGSVMTRFIEKLAKVFGFLLILFGIGMILLGYRLGKDGDLGVKDGQLYEKNKNLK